MNDLLASIRRLLAGSADPALREGAQRFFKEGVACYGVPGAKVREIALQGLARLKGEPKRAVLRLCDELLRSGILEEARVACRWAYAVRPGYAAEDLTVFERWLDARVTNWVSCDNLCSRCVSPLLEMHPGAVTRLYEWALSANRWMRRGAAVSLVLPARKGLFLEHVFGIADSLAADLDDLVQKGCGWLLKAAGEAREDAVFEFIMERRNTMSRAALRCAVEKMPLERRLAVLGG